MSGKSQGVGSAKGARPPELSSARKIPAFFPPLSCKRCKQKRHLVGEIGDGGNGLKGRIGGRFAESKLRNVKKRSKKLDILAL